MTFKAALVQMRSGEDVARNIADAEGLIRQAARGGARFIATPENTTLMAADGGAKLAQSFDEAQDPALPVFRALARELSVTLLIGSLAISLMGRRLRPARMMIVFALVWYALLLGFVLMPNATFGRVMLVLAGCAQSFSMVPMAVMLLHSAGERFRGRVMGVRMLAIYGLPLGLLAAGALIERLGFIATASLYCAIGFALTALIAFRWRAALWPLEAPANAR